MSEVGSVELCPHCMRTQPTRTVEHASGTEWLCAVCGAQVDFAHKEDFDDDDLGEPIGSCENCEADLYDYEDDGTGLCDQCQFYVKESLADAQSRLDEQPPNPATGGP